MSVSLYLGLSLCVHAHVTLSLYRFPPRLTTIRGFLQLSMAQQGRSPRSSFQSCWAGPGNHVQGSGCPCSPSLLLSSSCWQSVLWWRSTLGQNCTKAMPLSPQSHHPQSRRAASTSSAGACWAIRTVMKMPSRNLPALTPTLCQMGPGSASMKSRFCRRETLESWPQLYQNKKLDRVVHAKLLQLCLTLCNPMDYHPLGSFVHGILQARILEWVAVPSTREFSQPGE